MPTPVCTSCNDYIIDGDQCSTCKEATHLSCCGYGHVLTCRNCGLHRDVKSYCPHCRHCRRCCQCFSNCCHECWSKKLYASYFCSGCRLCEEHCRCATSSFNAARAAARTARFALAAVEARRRAIIEEDNRRRAREADGTVFIPASTGKDLVVPSKLSAVGLSEIYLGGTIAGSKKNGFIIRNLPTQFKENRSRRFLCPEIEVAGGPSRGDVDAFLNPWLGRTVHDGSLSAHGFEINLMPSQGDVYLTVVRKLCSYLKENGGKVDKTCGLHVHVDARDFDYMDVRKLVFLYEVCEPAIYAALPVERHTSRYCQPCGYRFASHLRAGEELSEQEVAAEGKKKDFKRPVRTMVYGKSGMVRVNGKYGDGDARVVRYMGLNLYSYFYRGSVEFRHAPGSIDPDYIIPWSLMCGGLLDSAMKLSERQIVDFRKPFLEDADLYRQAFNGGRLVNLGVFEESKKVLFQCIPEVSQELLTKLYKKDKPEQVSPALNNGSGTSAGSNRGGTSTFRVWNVDTTFPPPTFNF